MVNVSAKSIDHGRKVLNQAVPENIAVPAPVMVTVLPLPH